MNDSFEHVTDPHEVMKSIKRLLAPNGIARIKLPVYPNIAYDMFGANWYQLDAPRHIFLHSKESLSYLADQHGLMILKREYDSNSKQIVRSFLYSNDVPFWEQSESIVNQFFTPEIIADLEASCKEANQNEYGDHAVFYFVHSDHPLL
jgi:SAM-dependent methyltransferase